MNTKQTITSLPTTFVILILLLVVQIRLSAQESWDFKTTDSLTFELYQQGKWSALIREGNLALSKGYDYYYLRMRLGIAYFNLQRYRQAAQHFEKALSNSSTSQIAFDYLSLSYQWGGMETDAAALGKRFQSLSNTASDSGNLINGVMLFTGISLSDGIDRFKELDLDGDENIYGEITGNGNGIYGHAGIVFSPANQFRWYFGYTGLQIGKYQRITMSGIDTLNEYKLSQSQLYASAPVRFALGWHVTPAFNFIRFTGYPFAVSYDTINYRYIIQKNNDSGTGYLVSLRIMKEMPHFNAGFAFANSNLNEKQQWQGTIMAGVYPFANLNQYIIARFSALSEDNEFNRHFKITGGSRIFSSLWLQGSYLKGNLQNAHDDNGLIVFNSSGKITSRANFTAFILLSPKFTIQFDYAISKQEDPRIQYTDYNTYIWKSVSYNNHHIMGGVKWKL